MKFFFVLIAVSIVSSMQGSQKEKLFEKVVKRPTAAVINEKAFKKNPLMYPSKVERASDKDERKKREVRSGITAKGHRRGAVISRPPLIADAVDLERAAIVMQRIPLSEQASLSSPRIPGILIIESPSAGQKKVSSVSAIPLAEL
ncbi:MAG TPA: hypothetical protein VFF04_00915 [Candidatus Babeliales bacterium]|nr:hypothetical protein [Candidatus Babeliales bacterium]